LRTISAVRSSSEYNLAAGADNLGEDLAELVATVPSG
jgi:hypothetical protein